MEDEGVSDSDDVREGGEIGGALQSLSWQLPKINIGAGAGRVLQLLFPIPVYSGLTCAQ